jgi:hypothetical protein
MSPATSAMMSWSFTGLSLPPRPRYRYGEGWEGGLEVNGRRFMEARAAKDSRRGRLRG